MNPTAFNEFCKQVDSRWRVQASDQFIVFWNSDGQEFSVQYPSLVKVLERWHDRNEEIRQFIEGHTEFEADIGPWAYKEGVFRDVFKNFFQELEFSGVRTQARSQTRGLMQTMSKLVGAAIANRACGPNDPLLLDQESLRLFIAKEGLSQSAPDIYEAFKKVCSFCVEYTASNQPWLRNDPKCIEVVQHLTTLAEWLKGEFGNYRGIEMKVSVALGAGNYPHIPWIAICPPGQEVNEGAYVALCFGKEGNGLVAGFADSATAPVGLQTVDRRSNAPVRIDVDGSSQGTRYNNVFENPLEVELNTFNAGILRDHIKGSLDRCVDFFRLEPTQNFSFSELSQFVEAVKNCGFVSEEQLESRFVKSLLTKPFVILTGNSGTGKTKLGQLLAHWLTGHKEEAKCGYAVVPVGADWTDNRNVVGFVNHLRPNPKQKDRPIFNSTPVLDVILRANADNSRPYFLILDEMNLSHVERYFADMLSAMESGKGIVLHSEAEPLQTGAGITVPPTIAFPDNLFVIGTVNVDETTYMFSPKVLDRANVIEFRVAATGVQGFLNGGGTAILPIQMAPTGYAEGFLDLSRRVKDPVKPSLKLAKPETDLPEGVFEKLRQCREELENLFAILQGSRQEFAYRTIKDILSYVHVDYELTENSLGWDQARCMDVQVLQKILPKLHGSKKRVSPGLVALAKYCEALDVKEALELAREEVNPELYKASETDRCKTPVLKDSYAKLCEMILAVRRDQFVSFIQ